MPSSSVATATCRTISCRILRTERADACRLRSFWPYSAETQSLPKGASLNDYDPPDRDHDPQYEIGKFAAVGVHAEFVGLGGGF